MVIETIPKFMFFGGKKYRHYKNYKTKTEAVKNARRVRGETGMWARVHKNATGTTAKKNAYTVYVR